jgi:polyhydroxybutyrate depolymerase
MRKSRQKATVFRVLVFLTAPILSLALIAHRHFGGAASFGQLFERDREDAVAFGGLQRTYRVHLPRSYDQKKSAPIVLALHGYGGAGRSMNLLTGFDKLADEAGFIVVYPDGVDRAWNDGRGTIKRQDVDDVGFISALIDRLSHTYNIDRARVYATGMSNGGMMSARLGCELSDKIAAIATVAGNLNVDISGNCARGRPISMLIMHGTSDPIVPYEGGSIRSFGGRGEGGSVLSVQAAAKVWAGRDMCPASSAPERTELQDSNPSDGTGVTREVYGKCGQKTEVVVYTIVGGGHTWPSGLQYLPALVIGKTTRQIDGSRIIWDFFSNERLE